MNSQLKKQIFLVLTSVILAVFLLTACTDKTLDPIFWTIENEVEVSDDRGLEDTLNVFKIIDKGNNYYIAANQVYYRLKGESGTWLPVSPPAAGALCNTIECFSTTGDIVAGFYDSAGGTGLGLWKSSNPGSVEWERITDSNLAGDMQIVMIKEAGGYLFVSTNEYSLYRTGDLNTFTRVQFDGQDTLSSPINDITSDGAATYWTIAGMTLYSQATDPPTNLSPVSGPVVTKPLGGVYYSSAKNKLYLSSKDGKLFTNADWADPLDIDVDTEVVPFTTFLELDPANASSDLFVGTGGYGYYKLVGGDISVIDKIERRPDYNISDMYKGVVLSFYKDPLTSAAEGTIFACTYGAGLWRASWDSINVYWAWKQE